MGSNKLAAILTAALVLLCCRAYAWECSVELNAPSAIKAGETKQLSATGAPQGGYFTWSNTPNLVTSGPAAELTGFEPDRELTDYIYVVVYYTTPKGKTCSDMKYIYVCGCSLEIQGPAQARMNETVTLTAEGAGEGGIYEWEAPEGAEIIPYGDLTIADFTAAETGAYTVTVEYTGEDGKTCTAEHTINVACPVEISGPAGAAFGETVTLTARAQPGGGTFKWKPIPGLVDYGSTAEFTAPDPGEYELEVTYTDMYGSSCTVSRLLSVGCSADITGPGTAFTGETITLESSASPPNSIFEKWSDTPGLVGFGPEAEFTGPEMGDYDVEVFYRGPDGGVCTDTHTITVECDMSISGPDESLTGETVKLYADAAGGEGGKYAWMCLPEADIEAYGNTAFFMSHDPGYYWLTAEYKDEQGRGCFQNHFVEVKCPCSVEIYGDQVVPAGGSASLEAEGAPNPDSGFYFWTPVEGLAPEQGGTAEFVARHPGTETIEVRYYARPECSDYDCFCRHDITAWGVESVRPAANCVCTGTLLTKDLFEIQTEPSGFEEEVVVSPPVFITSSQSEDVRVTASSSSGEYADTASTTLTVVNPDVKTSTDFDISVPNYIIKPLKKVGLADEVEISISENFQKYKECCIYGPGTSVDGSFSASLSIGAGPYTIVGVPIPAQWKDFVAADVLNVSLEGSGNPKICGRYSACEDVTTWTGSGSLKAGVELAFLVKASVPEVLVIKGKISGSTEITESFDVEDEDLIVTTKWGGLTASGKLIIKMSSVEGFAKCGLKEVYFNDKEMAPVKVALPDF